MLNEMLKKDSLSTKFDLDMVRYVEALLSTMEVKDSDIRDIFIKKYNELCDEMRKIYKLI